MADRTPSSDKDDKDTPASRPAAQSSTVSSRPQTAPASPQPAHATPTTVQQAVVHEAAAQSVPHQRDPAHGTDTVHTAPAVTQPTSVATLELAVAGEPLHRMRRYLELIQATSVELPNSEPLAALLVTVRQAMQQLFTVPAVLDDMP